MRAFLQVAIAITALGITPADYRKETGQDCPPPCNCSFDFNQCPYYTNPMPDYVSGDPSEISPSLRSRMSLLIPQYLDVLDKMHPPKYNSTYGVSVVTGLAGQAYLYLKLYKLRGDIQWLLKARSYVDEALSHTSITDGVSVMTSSLGAYAVAAAVYQYQGLQDRATAAADLIVKAYDEDKRHPAPIDVFIRGRAGLLTAGMLVNNELGRDVVDQKSLVRVAMDIVDHGARYGKANNILWWPASDPSATTYQIGQAVGISGVLSQVMKFNEVVTNNTVRTLIRNTIDYVIKTYQKADDGNFVEPPPSGEDVLQWCHGAPGVAGMLALAYKRFGDPAHLAAVHRATDGIWKKGLIVKGLALCHGISGNSYMLMYVSSIIREPKQMYRAIQLQEFVTQTPLLSAVTVMRQPTPATEAFTLWFGSYAGAVLLWSDLLSDPNQAAFPVWSGHV